MNYLITGGAGFIGSNIAEELVKRGHKVRILDNFSTGSRENLASIANQIEIIDGDVSEIDEFFVFGDINCEFLIKVF